MRRTAITLVRALFVVGLCLGGWAPAAWGQEPETVYVRVDYVSVPAGAEADYLALENDVWRPIHEERRRQGRLLNRSVYDVQFAPPGTPYNYVATEVYADLASAEADELARVLREMNPERDPAAVLSRTMASRHVVHSELWALVTRITPQNADQPTGRHLAVNFMTVPTNGRAEYFSVENEVWAPIHQVRADDGSMGGWALYSLVLPRGEALDYQFGTVDFFDSLDAAAAGITGGQIRQAHPGASELEVDAMLDRTDASRAIYKTELWTLVSTLNPLPN